MTNIFLKIYLLYHEFVSVYYSLPRILVCERIVECLVTC